MKPYHFHGQTHVLEAPKGWDHEAEGECIGLPVRIEDGVSYSVWKPSDEDLARLNAGGGVVVAVHGGQPPIWTDTLPADSLLVSA